MEAENGELSTFSGETIFLLCASLAIISTNIGLFTWSFRRRNTEKTHTLFIVTMSAGNYLAGVSLLALCLLQLLYQHTNIISGHLCTFARVFGFIGYESMLGNLLLQVIERALCNWSTKWSPGVKPQVILSLLSSMWLLTLVLSVPTMIRSTTDITSTRQCVIGHQGNHCSWGEFYAIMMHFGFNGLIVVSVAGLLVYGWWKCCCSALLTVQHKVERWFLIKTTLLAVTALVCWSPGLVIVIQRIWSPTTPDHLHLPFVSDTTIFWCSICSLTFYGFFNTLVFTLFSIRSGTEKRKLMKRYPTVLATTWFKGAKRVSIRLSRYLECGQNLTQFEAVLMTSCISKRVTALHRQGLVHSAINAENVYLEKDESGSLVHFQLAGIATRPARSAFATCANQDLQDIAKLFDDVNLAREMQDQQDARVHPLLRSVKSRSVHAKRPLRSVRSRLRTHSERNYRTSTEGVISRRSRKQHVNTTLEAPKYSLEDIARTVETFGLSQIED